MIKEFMLKTINDGNVALEKIPAGKVRQLAKLIKSSKATASLSNKWLVTHKLGKSILLGTSIQRFHQENTRRKGDLSSQGNQFTRMLVMNINKCQVITKRVQSLRMHIRTRRDAQSVDSQPVWKAFSALQGNFNVKLVISLDILLVFVTKRNKLHSSLADQRIINCKQEQCMCMRMPYAASVKRVPVMTHFTCNSKYSAHKPVSRRLPHHLI